MAPDREPTKASGPVGGSLIMRRSRTAMRNTVSARLSRYGSRIACCLGRGRRAPWVKGRSITWWQSPASRCSLAGRSLPQRRPRGADSCRAHPHGGVVTSRHRPACRVACTTTRRGVRRCPRIPRRARTVRRTCRAGLHSSLARLIVIVRDTPNPPAGPASVDRFTRRAHGRGSAAARRPARRVAEQAAVSGHDGTPQARVGLRSQ